jgi:pyrroloquinoline quinone (PQQ) biosynthesis protein C
MVATQRTVIEDLEAALAQPRRRLLGCELVQRFLRGDLTEEHYIRFLQETWHFVQHTPTHLQIAAGRLEGPMRSRFLHHAAEETGHDRWALADLAALGVDTAAVVRSTPLPETRRLIAYQRHTAESLEPLALLGLEYGMEGFTAQSGGAALEGLARGLALPPEATRFLRRHARLDVHHVDEDVDAIERFVRTQAQRAAVVTNARVSMMLYAGVYDGICRVVRAAGV